MARNRHESTSDSRRRFLNAAAWAAPLCIASDTREDLQDWAPSRQLRFDTEMLEPGAYEAVERTRKGEMNAESYAARLVEQYHAHKDMNVFVFTMRRACSKALDPSTGPARGAADSAWLLACHSR